MVAQLRSHHWLERTAAGLDAWRQARLAPPDREVLTQLKQSQTVGQLLKGFSGDVAALSHTVQHLARQGWVRIHVEGPPATEATPAIEAPVDHLASLLARQAPPAAVPFPEPVPPAPSPSPASPSAPVADAASKADLGWGELKTTAQLEAEWAAEARRVRPEGREALLQAMGLQGDRPEAVIAERTRVSVTLTPQEQAEALRQVPEGREALLEAMGLSLGPDGERRPPPLVEEPPVRPFVGGGVEGLLAALAAVEGPTPAHEWADSSVDASETHLPADGAEASRTAERWAVPSYAWSATGAESSDESEAMGKKSPNAPISADRQKRQQALAFDQSLAQEQKAAQARRDAFRERQAQEAAEREARFAAQRQQEAVQQGTTLLGLSERLRRRQDRQRDEDR